MTETLTLARVNKSDEFYTRYEDIEKEMSYYMDSFKGKVVYCNCDTLTSNFFKYFVTHFHELGLKKLYISGLNCKAFEYDGSNNREIESEGNFDFRSEESIEILRNSDIVVTNPPFSLFRDYIAQLMEYKKKFLVIGNTNAISYNNIFPYIKRNELWLGASTFNTGMYFNVPDDYTYADSYKFKRIIDGKKVIRVASVCWFTNLPHEKRNECISLTCEYSEEKYPKYENFDAIEVGRYKDIPKNYTGMMGVPITFIGKFNLKQFEIIGLTSAGKGEGLIKGFDGGNRPILNGKTLYARILIKKKIVDYDSRCFN